MSLDSDVIVDRRRIRRKLTFWRVAAAVIAIAAIVGVGVVAAGGRGTFSTSNTIARVNIDGLIRSDQDRVEALERLGKSSYAAVVVHVNSPGGTTAGSEQLYDSLMQLKAKKPLVVVVEGLAASGGYITAIASDHIVAQQTSLVGSIGVLFQYPNVSELLKTVGVKMEEIKSSPLKAAPNGFEPTSPEARAAIDGLVKDSYACRVVDVAWLHRGWQALRVGHRREVAVVGVADPARARQIGAVFAGAAAAFERLVGRGDDVRHEAVAIGGEAIAVEFRIGRRACAEAMVMLSGFWIVGWT